MPSAPARGAFGTRRSRRAGESSRRGRWRRSRSRSRARSRRRRCPPDRRRSPPVREHAGAGRPSWPRPRRRARARCDGMASLRGRTAQVAGSRRGEHRVGRARFGRPTSNGAVPRGAEDDAAEDHRAGKHEQRQDHADLPHRVEPVEEAVHGQEHTDVCRAEGEPQAPRERRATRSTGRARGRRSASTPCC